MGGVLSALAAIGSAVGAYLTSIGVAAGILTVGEITVLEAVGGTAFFAASGAIIEELTVVSVSTVIGLTLFGQALVGVSAFGALFGVSYGIASAIDQKNPVTNPGTPATILEKIDERSLLCRLEDGKVQCGDSRKRKMRIQRGESEQSTMLSDEENIRISRKRHKNVRKSCKVTTRRKVLVKNKRLRRKNCK